MLMLHTLTGKYLRSLHKRTIKELEDMRSVAKSETSAWDSRRVRTRSDMADTLLKLRRRDCTAEDCARQASVTLTSFIDAPEVPISPRLGSHLRTIRPTCSDPSRLLSSSDTPHTPHSVAHVFVDTV